MTIELTGFTRSGPGEPQPIGDAPRVAVVCDAGRTASGGCVRRVDAPSEMHPAYIDGEWRLYGDPAVDVPDGWEAVPDPWRRTSRFTGRPLILHLCPACVAAGEMPANAELAGT